MKKNFLLLFLKVAVHICQEQIYNFKGTALYFQLETEKKNNCYNATTKSICYGNGPLFPARNKDTEKNYFEISRNDKQYSMGTALYFQLERDEKIAFLDSTFGDELAECNVLIQLFRVRKSNRKRQQGNM